jgi:PAS domain S-box-containing protein
MNLDQPPEFNNTSEEQIWEPTLPDPPPAQAPNGHPKARRLPIKFDGASAAEAMPRPYPPPRLQQAFEFEGLLVDILARFVNLPAREVDGEIEGALGRVCSFLELARAGLWLTSQDGTDSFTLTHSSSQRQKRRDGNDDRPSDEATPGAIPISTESRTLFPWSSGQAARGETISFSTLEDLPAEAGPDKASLAHLGIQSGAVIPFLVEGRVLGAVSFMRYTDQKPWPELLLKRLHFVAEVIAQIMARRLSDERLDASEAQLNLAAASAGAALWSLDLRTGRIETTAKGMELLRLPPNAELTFEGFLSMVHPEDCERVVRTQEAVIASHGELNIEFRLVFGNGDVRWVHARGRCQNGSAGVPKRLTGVSVDITVRRNTENYLRESEARFRAIADSAPVLIWMAGLDKGCTFFNKPWLDFTGRTAEQEMGNGWAEGVHPEDLAKCLQAYTAAFDSRSSFVLQYRLRRRDGQYRWLSDNGVPRFDPEGNFSGYIGSCVDVTERRTAEEALSRSFEEIRQLKDRLQAESDYLKAEIKVSHAHGQIIGQSKGIKRVLHNVEQVAPADCAVLITGETGTGKELIAQEIHRLSARKERVMVLVNCAALPSALVESELFGRERGAYTGALTSQVGRFEVANSSTIFLDEVGELTLEVQAKLLRVLQEGEFQRLGSPKTHKVDVRILAATNRDLAGEVRKGRFREDLYYRLRVFPISIPPLRERLEDIPLLALAFMEEFSTRMGKKITKLPRKAMEMLQAHTWQGNIRELRNVIEHSVILTAGDTLKLTVPGEAPTREAQPVTLAEAEREHILRTLESTGWRIKGPYGAAGRLGLRPSTLYSRMQKLGIPHRRKKDERPSPG